MQAAHAADTGTRKDRRIVRICRRLERFAFKKGDARGPGRRKRGPSMLSVYPTRAGGARRPASSGAPDAGRVRRGDRLRKRAVVRFCAVLMGYIYVTWRIFSLSPRRRRRARS